MYIKENMETKIETLFLKSFFEVKTILWETSVPLSCAELQWEQSPFNIPVKTKWQQ